MPGDLVELDTLDVRPLPGIVLKHFTARDVVSRWDVLEAHRRATSTAAAAFLDQIEKQCPSPSGHARSTAVASSLPLSKEPVKLNRALQKWEATYNQLRPHQALGHLTPSQSLAAQPLPGPPPMPEITGVRHRLNEYNLLP